jgi:hypothetical protein
MTKEELHALAARLEAAEGPCGADAGPIAELIDAAFAGRPVWRGARADALGSTDAVLGLVAEALPSWSVHISGQSAAAAGRWTCTIRETGVRDDDELIGVGRAETLPNAVTAALLNIIGMRAAAG